MPVSRAFSLRRRGPGLLLGHARNALSPRRLSTTPPQAPPPGSRQQHNSEFFYRPDHDSALRKASELPDGSRLRSWLLAVCTGAATVYIGLFAAPLVGVGSVDHATRLLRSHSAVLQRTGADRLTVLVSASDRLARAAVDGGAVDTLLALLDSPGPTQGAAAAALAALARAPCGADALRAAPGLLSLQGLASAESGEAGQLAREALLSLGLITSFAAPAAGVRT